MKDRDFRFPSFLRQRESSHLLKRLDTRFHGYDDTQLISESLERLIFSRFMVFKGSRDEKIG